MTYPRDAVREIAGCSGERDTQIQLLGTAAHALQCIYKARKWFLTRGDLEYTALWILYAATPLARIEVLQARLLADREVIPQAMKLNPNFFQMIYTDLLNTKKTKKNVQAALEAAEAYIAKRAESLFGPVLGHLRETGETRSATDIDDHFKRNFGVEGLATACEYLADQSLLGKDSVPLQLTSQRVERRRRKSQGRCDCRKQKSPSHRRRTVALDSHVSLPVYVLSSPRMHRNSEVGTPGLS
jgi:hypothetical protein